MIDKPKPGFEQERREINRARKDAHPDWPTHRTIFYPPRQPPVLISETVPIGRWKGTYYCKYCYSEHDEWWEMDEADYACHGIILCGRCEHTSMGS
jgi:hypothetical protein